MAFLLGILLFWLGYTLILAAVAATSRLVLWLRVLFRVRAAERRLGRGLTRAEAWNLGLEVGRATMVSRSDPE